MVNFSSNNIHSLTWAPSQLITLDKAERIYRPRGGGLETNSLKIPPIAQLAWPSPGNYRPKLENKNKCQSCYSLFIKSWSYSGHWENKDATLNNIELILLSLSQSTIMRSHPHNVGSRVSGRVECNGMKNLQPFASWFHNNLQQISTELAEIASEECLSI